MMSSFRKAAAILAAVLFFLAFGQSRTHGQVIPTTPIIQQLPPQLRDDLYVTDLAGVLDQWNRFELLLPTKAELRPFLVQRVSETVRLRTYPYETESWQSNILKNFDALPAQVKPEKRLDPSAGMLLLLLFLKGRDQFERQVKRDDLRKGLNLSLFLVLGSAQQAAKGQTIDPTAVSSSLLTWWTTVWPFCK